MMIARAPRNSERSQPSFFALQASTEIGLEVAKSLNWSLGAHEERDFEDGEHKSRPLDSVEGAEVFVLHGLYGGPEESANDKLCRLLFFVGALKDAGARRVTAVVPYMCYARKDRRTKAHDPVTTRYIGALFEAAGTDCVVTLDVHNAVAFENAFRCRTVALTAAPLFVDYVRSMERDKLCVISPDPGGVKRAQLLREALEQSLGIPIGKGFVDKRRSAGIVSGSVFVGDTEGATALIVDDLISTGNTLLRAARAAREAGAQSVIALVTHGLFLSGSIDAIADPAIDRLVATDSVPAFRLGTHAVRQKIDTLACADLLAEAIHRLYNSVSLDDLFVF